MTYHVTLQGVEVEFAPPKITHIVVNHNLKCISYHLSHFRGLGLGLKYVDTTIKTTKYYGGSFCNFLGLMDLSSIFLKKTDFTQKRDSSRL